MVELFSQADDLLEKHIDNNMESLQKDAPEFCNQYYAAQGR